MSIKINGVKIDNLGEPELYSHLTSLAISNESNTENLKKDHYREDKMNMYIEESRRNKQKVDIRDNKTQFKNKNTPIELIEELIDEGLIKLNKD